MSNYFKFLCIIACSVANKTDYQSLVLSVAAIRWLLKTVSNAIYFSFEFLFNLDPKQISILHLNIFLNLLNNALTNPHIIRIWHIKRSLSSINTIFPLTRSEAIFSNHSFELVTKCLTLLIAPALQLWQHFFESLLYRVFYILT